MATQTDTLDRIKALRSTAASFATFHTTFAEKYQRDSSCDKKGFGFGKDDRFAAFKVSTTFSSWAGYYGNSSSSSVMSIYHDKIVDAFFVKALNIHQRELFATVARLMREEAATLTDKAAREIDELKAMLDAALADAEAPDAALASARTSDAVAASSELAP